MLKIKDTVTETKNTLIFLLVDQTWWRKLCSRRYINRFVKNQKAKRSKTKQNKTKQKNPEYLSTVGQLQKV